jgi:hypothetical protein
VNDPKCQAQLRIGHWVFIFLAFERDTTNYRGTLVKIVKKGQKSTHPTVHLVKNLDLFAAFYLNSVCFQTFLEILPIASSFS